MRIQLSDHFTYKRLIHFVLPSIFMIICISVYGIIDGFFVSNYVGKNPFAATPPSLPMKRRRLSIPSAKALPERWIPRSWTR